MAQFPDRSNWIKLPQPFNLGAKNTIVAQLQGWYHVIYTDYVKHARSLTFNWNWFERKRVFGLNYTSDFSFISINTVVKIAYDGNYGFSIRVENNPSDSPNPLLKGGDSASFFIKYLSPL